MLYVTSAQSKWNAIVWERGEQTPTTFEAHTYHTISAGAGNNRNSLGVEKASDCGSGNVLLALERVSDELLSVGRR